MDVKLTLVLVVVVLLAVQDLVEAEFLYNRVFPKEDELKDLGLKCIPGRTFMKIQEKPVNNDMKDSDDEDGRRSHMRFTTDDESCEICVCSVEAKDIYCSKRPARNVNECIMLATVTEKFKKNEPFEHERTLAYRIRRDYLWHNDEIPYEAKAKCFRGHSYYSNSIKANDTDIDIPSSVESLLDYKNKDICYFCVCSMHGTSAGCISRNVWFCQYFRDIRGEDAARDRYRILFQQDRPTYFRQLSYRLRRTMDNGMFDLIDSGGDTLCCGHPDGHRRQLHHQVRNKIRLMKKKINKENLMMGQQGGDYEDFVVNND